MKPFFQKANAIMENICYVIIFLFVLKTIIFVPIEFYNFILNRMK